MTTQAIPSRGVLYVKWGADDRYLNRSIASVRAHHPELPIHIHRLPDTATLLDKACMLDASPFDLTAFLDVDTVVLDRLDFAFEMAARHALACAICECPWARRYGGIRALAAQRPAHEGFADAVEYNTGVLFFSKAAKPVFDRWAELSRALDSSIKFYCNAGDGTQQLAVMPYNDQAGFSLAVAEAARQPFILPLNWNLRPGWHRSWHGPLKIWLDYSDPPPAIGEWQARSRMPGAPIAYAQLAT
jgi:hypothetical protein